MVVSLSQQHLNLFEKKLFMSPAAATKIRQNGVLSCILDGLMVQLRRMFLLDSKCMCMVGFQSTACHIDQCSKDLLPLTCLVIRTKCFSGHLGPLRFCSVGTYFSSTYSMQYTSAICLFTGKFIIPKVSNVASICFISLILSIFPTGILEMGWSEVGIDESWRNEQFWVVGDVFALLFAVVHGPLKVLAGIDDNFTVTSKPSDEDGDFAELYMFKWMTLLIPPTTFLIINLVGVVVGIGYAINSGY